jgi:hypothetical protein
MKYNNQIKKAFFIFSIIFILLFLFNFAVNSQTLTSIIKSIFNKYPELIKIVNKPVRQAIIEVENNISNVATTGIIYPPNMGGTNSQGYFTMPVATAGEYVFGGWNRCESHKRGSRELIGSIYTVAKRWKEKYPNSRFTIGDLNAGPPHASHKNGVDVDIMVYGSPPATQITAPVDANIDLGKMFIDTGVVKLIIFGTSESDQRGVSVRNAWKQYANSKGVSFQTYPYRGHDDHFHVRINDQFIGPVDAPGPCR